MQYPYPKWFALLFASTALVAACSSQPDDDNSTYTEGFGPQGQDSLDPSWDTEEERLDDLDLPKHDVVIDGEKTVSEYGQKQWDLYNDGDYEREDYEEAFLNFAACVEDDDGWINYLDLDDEIIMYTTTASSDPDDYCYTTHYELIDSDWQGKHPQDQSDEIQYYIDCLEDEDIEPAHKEPATEPGEAQDEQSFDLWEQAQENNADCEYIDPTIDELFDD